MLLFCFGLEYEGNLENLRFSDTFSSAAERRRFSVEKTENVQGEILNDTTVWSQIRSWPSPQRESIPVPLNILYFLVFH